MRRAIVVLALAAFACKERSPTASTGSAGAAYVNAIVDIMQANSVHRKSIDWTTFRSQVMATVPVGASIDDSYTAIDLALELLGDNHSFFHAVDGLELHASTLDCTAPVVPAATPPAADIGYVRVRGIGGNAAQEQSYTDSLQAIIRAADNAHISGWIVDLRGNTGGSVGPMIAGVGPILGTGTTVYFVDADGNRIPLGYDGSAAEEDGVVAQAASNPYTLLASAPRVAVLLDRGAGSAGEATAIAFKQRPNTRFFGTGTCGVSTGNVIYTLSDGASLALTVAIDADRTGTLYGGPVLPDSLIADTSAVVPAAVAWLRASHQ